MNFDAIAVLIVFLPARGIDHERVCGQADPRSSLIWALLASGQIVMRKIDGWNTLSTVSSDQQKLDAAA